MQIVSVAGVCGGYCFVSKMGDVDKFVNRCLVFRLDMIIFAA